MINFHALVEREVPAYPGRFYQSDQGPSTTGLCQSATTNPAHPEAVNLTPISQCFRIAGYLVASDDRRPIYVRPWLSIQPMLLCPGLLTLDPEAWGTPSALA